MKTFIPITKVDETRREVWGVAAEEAVDARGEMMDYALSKPNFLEWSAQIQKATNGASLGNVRAMHQPIAAGKLIDISFDDEVKKINVGAKIVDDNEWKKVVEGVYTGFSIGGHYGKQKFESGVLKYEAIPAEISIVDNPCMKGATFTMVKSDGANEEVPFSTTVDGDSDVSANLSQAVHSLLLERENLQKAGARNSKRDLEMIQAIHDHACSLGAGCSDMGKAEDGNLKKEDFFADEPGWVAWLAAQEVDSVTTALSFVSALAGRMVTADAMTASKLTQAASLIAEALQTKMAEQAAATEAAVTDQAQDEVLEEQIETNAEAAPEPTGESEAAKAEETTSEEEAAAGDEEDDMNKAVTTDQLEAFIGQIKTILATQAAEPLQKLDATTSSLTKRFDEVAAELGALKSRIDTLEKAPVNMGPVLREVPIAGGADGDVTLATLDELIKSQVDPQVRQALMNQRTQLALKQVHRAGGHRIG